jgi:hypothetical protein
MKYSVYRYDMLMKEKWLMLLIKILFLIIIVLLKKISLLNIYFLILVCSLILINFYCIEIFHKHVYWVSQIPITRDPGMNLC